MIWFVKTDISSNFLKAGFHKFYLIHSSIHYPKGLLKKKNEKLEKSEGKPANILVG